MKKTMAAVMTAGALTAPALLAPPAAHATDLNKAVCDAFGAEAQGWLLRGTARPIATRMVVAAGTPLPDARAVIQSTVTTVCPQYTKLL